MVALGQTITVVNKSGKVVSTSKHLVNVFKEAKSAYSQRKAEIQAVRDGELEQRRIQLALENYHIDDDRKSKASSHRSKKSSKSKSHRGGKPLLERGYTDSFYANDKAGKPGSSPLKDEYKPDEIRNNQLARRYTDGPLALFTSKSSKRSKSDADIDMDLAYGDLPPPLPDHRGENELELRNKMNGLTRMLDEANCLQYSVVTMIDSLQKNPDALAAVALTLAEISNIVAKLGPGALGTLKATFPAAVALLASPQFMIAAGVGIGVTIVALGGYKIIKKIQSNNEENAMLSAGGPVRAIEEPEEQLMLDELQPPELSRIERWRRGIADAAANSVGTSVDGEFVTPGAADRFIKEGVLKEDDLKSRRSARSKTAKSTHSSKTKKTHKSSSSTKSDKEKVRRKEPSGIRMLFKTATA
ncbi:hypothetical protein GTA08_BOTSDO13788 [Neofusicoccum parvum]|uniref:Mfs general substrate transporter protein n=2 Tax=Neofusicoccum parvum TaxID=310453 RepID=R1EP40_BOTPV|nr:hypothetical protein UCRNP2_3701 [Neofusicoccum parvum UCRNP2]GME23671.1 hypothetical protein GTA08_BOTSDO13788 [Neofusicoccum parvum]GME56229.1 hypothetical protein GTA08_BOTSDO13788 [Neofusicoccum parvum]